MIKSPHPNFTIAFLRELATNRFISKTGKEYSEPEVIAMLHEKEERLADRAHRKNLKEKASTWNPVKEIHSFQALLTRLPSFSDRARESDTAKTVSTHYAPSFISPDTTFLLSEQQSVGLVSSASSDIASVEGAEQFPKVCAVNVHSSNRSPVTAPSKFTSYGRGLTMKKLDLKRKTIFGETVTKVFQYTKKSLNDAIEDNERKIKSLNEAMKENAHAGS